MKKKILIADDHQIVRLGVAFILEQKLSCPSVISFAESFAETKEKISMNHYDLLILDIDMPDTIYKAMIKILKDLQSDLKILIFSGYSEDIAIQYIDEGANGYVKKDSVDEEILGAISSLFEKGYYYSKNIMDMIISRSQKNNINPIERLSEREFQVFKLFAEGNGNIEIANLLDIKMPTVSTYKKNIFEKLNIKTIVELIRINDSLH